MAGLPLNPQQMSELFNRVQRAVWNIHVQEEVKLPTRTERVDTYYAGVCVRSNGLILTSSFVIRGAGEPSIFVQGRNSSRYYQVELVHHDSKLGLALLKANHLQNYHHIVTSSDTTFDVGQHVYSIFYPKEAFSPILLMGHLAYQYDPNAQDSDSCPFYRDAYYLLPGVCPDDLVPPTNPGPCVSLLQIARLGVTNENQDRSNNQLLNNFGFSEGRGSPVLDATGHLIGLVACQGGGFDHAIHVKHLVEFISENEPSEAVRESASGSSKQKHGPSKHKHVGQGGRYGKGGGYGKRCM